MISPPPPSALTPNLVELGHFIRNQRQRLGLTQVQLAVRLGAAQERVSLLENGAYGMPSLLALSRLAVALDVSLADVVEAAGFDVGGAPAVVLAGNEASTGVALLQVVHQLLAIEAISLKDALTQATTLLAKVMSVDKIDAFVHDPATDTLIAVGASQTAMGIRQHEIGMDRMPVVNRGREVEVFTTGETYLSGNTRADVHMLLGTTEGLGVQSMLAVPLEVAGVRRGVLVAEDSRRDIFTDVDVPFFETLACWVGMVVQHAESTAELSATAAAAAKGVAEDLMTILAHDLRDRLAPLAGHLTILQRRAEREERSDNLKNVAAARRQTDRVSHLTNQLMDAARLEKGLFALYYAPTDLTELVLQMVRELGSEPHTIDMQLPEALMADVDPDRIRQALDNVVRNAMRHSPDGVPICIELCAQARGEAEWAVLSVSDQGAGISPQLLPGIFVRFARGPGSSGLGLGLYVARGVADAHGGSLDVESAEGSGTTFRFSLPLRMTP